MTMLKLEVETVPLLLARRKEAREVYQQLDLSV
jgi:hypothetical protein